MTAAQNGVEQRLGAKSEGAPAEPATLDWADAIRAERATLRAERQARPAPPRDGAAEPKQMGPQTDAPAGRPGRLAAAMLLAIGASLTVAVAGARVIVGPPSEAAGPTAAEADVAQSQKRLDELGTERKRREDQLAELTRRANAKQSELAETEDRVTALEKRRVELQKQVAELAAPVSPSHDEVVSDDASGRPALPEAAPPPRAGEPPQRSSARVDDGPQEESVSAPRDAVVEDARAKKVAAHDSLRTLAAIQGDSAAALRRDGNAAPAAQGAAGPVRVFIHVLASDPAARERAQAVATQLRRQGLSVAEIRGVPHAVRRDAVRYFYDADRASVSAVQQAVREASPEGGPPVAQDFRGYGAPPRPGTVEIWLS